MTTIFALLRPAFEIPTVYRRQVYLTNVLSLIFCFLCLFLIGTLYGLFGWSNTLPFIFLTALFFAGLIGANRWICHRVGRMLFCLVPVGITMFITLFMKLNAPQSDIVYFDSRFILVISAILPGIIFRLEERNQFLIALGANLFCLVFFDPIHEILGIGYYQRGFTGPSYYYINYITVICFTALVCGIFLLRSVMEKAENALLLKNESLLQKQHEIEIRNHALQRQQTEIGFVNKKLEEANDVILSQQAELENNNTQLKAQVLEKNQELLKTNEELVKQNSELLQFSYTISHNLRAPVARLLGLTQLNQLSKDDGEKSYLQGLIEKSGQELDAVLNDLSQIISVRNDLYQTREKVLFEVEWNKTLSLFAENLNGKSNVKADFEQAPGVCGSRPVIQSIFYNLLSNAIKYQSLNRKLEIRVRSYSLSETSTMLEVSDNGLGIDLQGDGKNLFRLYKRFHSHVSGKGMGLYLVKTQIERMGGEIEAVSAVGCGTTFRILFKEPELKQVNVL